MIVNVDRALSRLALLLLFIATSATAISAYAEDNKNARGTVMLVGDVLTYNQRDIWEQIVEQAGGAIADIVVIAAAHERPKLYGSYAVRALTRYAPDTKLLPLAVSSDEFGVAHADVVNDIDHIKQVQEAGAIFFVGGEPQHLTNVLFNDDNLTPLVEAITEVYEKGGLVIGGIPNRTGAHTGLDAVQVLEHGQISEQKLYRGLGLMPENWYIDQHIFSPGRFAETLVAMRQLGKDFGIGVGTNSAAVIKDGQMKVIGESGAIIIDLSQAKFSSSGEFGLHNARVSYLGDGDQLSLNTLKITPNTTLLDGFEINPNAHDHQPLLPDGATSSDVLTSGRLRELLTVALDGKSRQSIGLVFDEIPDGQSVAEKGFQFRFYTGDDTNGWLVPASTGDNYTAYNIHLDVSPVTREQVAGLTQ